MTYYYRKLNKDNFEDDIKDLNNKIDIIYNSLENIIEERNNLLQLFNFRINDSISDENIFNDDIKVDSDNRYKLIFTCKSKPSDIYKYVFHIFIKSDFNNINLKFLINNKNFTYDIVVNKFKYIKIEEKFIFDKVEIFKIYLKSDKPLTIMKYSSYEVLINYNEATILNNQDHIKKLIYKTNKFNILDKKLNNYLTKFDKINEIIDILISDEYTKFYKTFYPIKNYDLSQNKFFISSESINIPLKANTYIIFEYIFNSEYTDIPLIVNLKIDDILEKDFDINLQRHNKIIHIFKLKYNVTKINFYLFLLNNEKYNDEKMKYLKKIIFNNRKIKFNIFSYNI